MTCEVLPRRSVPVYGTRTPAVFFPHPRRTRAPRADRRPEDSGSARRTRAVDALWNRSADSALRRAGAPRGTRSVVGVSASAWRVGRGREGAVGGASVGRPPGRTGSWIRWHGYAGRFGLFLVGHFRTPGPVASHGTRSGRDAGRVGRTRQGPG